MTISNELIPYSTMFRGHTSSHHQCVLQHLFGSHDVVYPSASPDHVKAASPEVHLPCPHTSSPY
jgi:hypothetical protein